MNILVVNDDGIASKGIRILAEKAKKFGNVFVVAPHTQQSATAHSITIHDSMKLHKHPDYMDGVKAWSLEGKPADCVKFALYGLNLDIDIVLSGINDGPNLGTDINYSGTIAGALEGALCGIPSIAFSTDFSHFEIAENNMNCVLEKILNDEVLSTEVIINVNFPSKEYKKTKGITITQQGRRPFLHEFELKDEAYWARGTWEKIEHSKGTDTYAHENGYISITPIHIDRTDYKYMIKLKKIFEY